MNNNLTRLEIARITQGLNVLEYDMKNFKANKYKSNFNAELLEIKTIRLKIKELEDE